MRLHRFLGALLIVAITATFAGHWAGGRRQPSLELPLGRPPAVSIDLYGNPLSPAIATYRIDTPEGHVEDHDLGVERLAPPEG